MCNKAGLHYNRYRYYSPYVGLFISKDPIGLLGGLNTFAYASNPVGWIDPLGLSNFSIPEKQYLYRGIHAGHPALQDAMRGIVSPGNANGTAIADDHNHGGVQTNSQFTSWTRSRVVAESFARSKGAGGVLLRVEVGAPQKDDCWKWEYSPDVWGEQEVLMKGVRKNIEVIKL